MHRLERHVPRLRQPLRPFVHGQERTDAMASAVVVVEPGLPLREAREDVDLRARGSGREAGARYGDHAAENAGEPSGLVTLAAFFRSDRTLAASAFALSEFVGLAGRRWGWSGWGAVRWTLAITGMPRSRPTAGRFPAGGWNSAPGGRLEPYLPGHRRPATRL